MVLLLLLASVAVDDCGFMRIPAPAGAVVAEGDVSRGACAAEPVPAKLRYDVRRGVAIARRALVQGESLGHVYVPARPEVLPGDRVALIAHIGHVTIARDMTALQAARRDQRFFARDAEGRVMIAPPLMMRARR